MHRAKVFFTVCAGLFLLALSYHLGARNAGAQQGSMVSGFTAEGINSDGNRALGHFAVITPNGDIFCRYMDTAGFGTGLTYAGNFWSGSGPTPAQRESFGAVKSRYRGERGAAQPATQDR